MGKDTLIQWCDTTANPTTGCDGCELHIPGKGGPCYAGVLHEQRLAKSLPKLYDKTFTNVRLAPGRMAKVAALPDLAGVTRPDKPWIPAAMPRLVFVGDMGDVLSGAVPFTYIEDEIIRPALSMHGRRHIYLILTKQPGRLAKFVRWLMAERGYGLPHNVWVGTSITGPTTAGRAQDLVLIPAAKRFVSLEPLHEYVDVARWFGMIDWVIIGGESEQRPHDAHPFCVRWVYRVINAGQAAGVPVFVKQLGSRPVVGSPLGDEPIPLTLKDHHGGDWEEWPEPLRVRQFPAPPDLSGFAVSVRNTWGPTFPAPPPPFLA